MITTVRSFEQMRCLVNDGRPVKRGLPEARIGMANSFLRPWLSLSKLVYLFYTSKTIDAVSPGSHKYGIAMKAT